MARIQAPSTGSGGASSALSTKVITATRDLTAAGAPTTVAYTGVGFKPTAIIVFGYIEGSFAFVNGMAAADKSNSAITYYGNNTATGLDAFIYCNVSGGYQTAVISTYDDDGFTLSWSKSSSPTGTLNLKFLCFK